jgi:hypothetical protein
MEKTAPKVFVKVEVERKSEPSAKKPKATNGSNMNC